MKTLWRISSHADLTGEGAKYASARWHTKGNPIVYLAESPAGAMLERLVHLLDTEGQLPETYDLLEIAVPENLGMKELMPAAGADWKNRSNLTRQIGDAWLDSRETAVARVPSVIVPRTWNVLLNPVHPDAKQVKVKSIARERFDDRLFRYGAP